MPKDSSLTPFTFVQKRDGRLAPFDADRIVQSLFAAGETLGRPDPFLARELTDSILHFLSAEAAGSTLTSEQIAELVAKLVRELGQPELARAYSEGRAKKGRADDDVPGPAARPLVSVEKIAGWVSKSIDPDQVAHLAAGACLQAYSLQDVFSRELVAAHHEGLLQLQGLDHPLTLAGSILPRSDWSWQGPLDLLIAAREIVGDFVAFDGLETLLGTYPMVGQSSPILRELLLGLRLSSLRAVLNLNTATQPGWAEELASGPLFSSQHHEPKAQNAWPETLLETVLSPAQILQRICCNWHLGERDFAPALRGRLLRLAKLSLQGVPLQFSFDRPRRSVALGEGLDRQHASLLIQVGLSLPRLAEQMGKPRDSDRFLGKLGSLARLALSAALRKREFLRKQSVRRPALSRGFLLERARAVIAPLGLEAVVRTFFGAELSSSGRGLEFARNVVARLHSALRDDGRVCLLETCLEGPGSFACAMDSDPALEQVAGVTPWDAASTPRQQLKAAGMLHAACDGGTCAVWLTGAEPTPAEQLADLLQWAWLNTAVGTVRFLLAPAHRAANISLLEPDMV